VSAKRYHRRGHRGRAQEEAAQKEEAQGEDARGTRRGQVAESQRPSPAQTLVHSNSVTLVERGHTPENSTGGRSRKWQGRTELTFSAGRSIPRLPRTG